MPQITTDLQHPDADLRLVAKVRSKIGAPHVIFDDDDYLSDLEDTANNVMRAAAMRLLAIANSEAHIQKVIETLELNTDGAKLSASYLATAKMFLTMAEPVTEAETPAPVVAPGKTIFPRRVDGYSRFSASDC